MTYSLLRRARELFGFTHTEMAEVVGMSRPGVEAICNGRYAEWLNPVQKRAMLDYCRLVRDQAIAAVDELELMN